MYYEHLNFKGKALTLTSTSPSDLSVVQSTIIHASGHGSAVNLFGANPRTRFSPGLSITGGYGTVNPAFGTNIFWGAGVYCDGASPTILGNVILSNSAPMELRAMSATAVASAASNPTPLLPAICWPAC